MRLNIIWAIFRKEITEALRDRLTLIVVLGLPILIYPLALTSLAKIQRAQEEVEDKRVSRVLIWGQPVDALAGFLERSNTIRLAAAEKIPDKIQRAFVLEKPDVADSTDAAKEPAASGLQVSDIADKSPGEARDFVRSALVKNQADAIMLIWPGTQEALDKLDSGRVTIYYDSVRPPSQKALERLQDGISGFRRELVESRQKKLKLPKGFSRPLEIRSTSVASAREEFGDHLGRLLPLLLIMLSATGALYAAVDLTAGEKDRATMQTLLCAPVLPLEIVAGKFLTVWTISLVSALANIASLAFTFTRIATAAHMPLVPFGVLAGVLGLLALVTCTVAAAFIGMAALARDAKDAGNFLSATLILIMLPVAASIMPGVELNIWTAFVPLVNISLLIKAAFLEGLSANIFFLTVVASVGYALLALVFAARVFGREEILLGGAASWRQLLSDENRRAPKPTPGLALALFVVVLVITFYGTLLVEKRSFTAMILTVQYGFFMLPTIALATAKRFPFADTFSLRRPSLRSVLGAFLIGLSGATAVAGITMRLLPPPDSLVEGLKEMLMVGDGQSLWLVLFLLAVTPALCEEALFRGMILSGLRRLGPGAAIGISALMFGLAHASIYRLLPTFFLGLALGYVAWRSRSIYCSMIVHALNNGLILILVNHEALLKRLNLSIDDLQFVPWSWTLGALAVMAMGLVLIAPPGKRMTET